MRVPRMSRAWGEGKGASDRSIPVRGSGPAAASPMPVVTAPASTAMAGFMKVMPVINKEMRSTIHVVRFLFILLLPLKGSRLKGVAYVLLIIQAVARIRGVH
jgi:hypothetical protein